MIHDTHKKISQKYCPRFGQIAVESGFVNGAQLAEAPARLVHQELNGQGHKWLGEILFEREWMSASQIEQVMTELFRRMRKEEEKNDRRSPPHAKDTVAEFNRRVKNP